MLMNKLMRPVGMTPLGSSEFLKRLLPVDIRCRCTHTTVVFAVSVHASTINHEVERVRF